MKKLSNLFVDRATFAVSTFSLFRWVHRRMGDRFHNPGKGRNGSLTWRHDETNDETNDVADDETRRVMTLRRMHDGG